MQDALFQKAKALGVQFRFNSPVEKVDLEQAMVTLKVFHDINNSS